MFCWRRLISVSAGVGSPGGFSCQPYTTPHKGGKDRDRFNSGPGSTELLRIQLEPWSPSWLFVQTPTGAGEYLRAKDNTKVDRALQNDRELRT